MSQPIEIKLLHKDAKVPQFATVGAAAVDLCAMLDEYTDGEIINPGESLAFKTGIAVSLNDHSIVAIIEGRSGLRFKHSIAPLASGVIDSDYQGEIMVSLHNHGKEMYCVCHGDRIAQMMFKRVERPNFMVVEQFSTQTERGENGLGSTGR